MYFPKLHSSLFRKKYLAHLDKALFEAIPGPEVPRDIRADVIGPAWQPHMVGSFADLALNDIKLLLSGADERISKIKRTRLDRRFSAEGVKIEGKNAVTYQTAHAKKVLEWVEVQSAHLAEVIKKLPVPEIEATAAAEWRTVIRTSGENALRRYVELAKLLRDGNQDAAPAVVAAGHGLSGLDRDSHQALRLMLQAAANSDTVARAWSDLEALDAVRLTALRCTQAVMKVAAVEPMLQAQQEHELNSSTPSFTAAAAMIEAVDSAIKRLNESGGFAQLDQEEEDAPPPPPPVEKQPESIRDIMQEIAANKKRFSQY